MDVNKDEILSTPKKNLSITYIRISACVILLLFLSFLNLQSQINFITAHKINQSLQNKTALKITFGAVF